MKPPTVRLAVAAVLFFGWIAYLAYLAFTTTKPIVLSRPQLLVANLIVIAEVDDLKSPVKVQEVSWPAARQAQFPAGTPLEVINLEEAKDRGWEGPKQYILPLLTDGKVYQLAPTPPSPGYPPRNPGKAGPPHIYPANPQTRAQLQEIHKP